MEEHINIFGTLRVLVAFAQFKKRKKHPWRSVNFSKVTGSSLQTKINTPPWVFSRFLNCTNATKSRNASHISVNRFGTKWISKPDS